MERIVHICRRGEWITAQDLGKYESESLTDEGYIHCSRPEQVLKVANAYFPKQVDLVLIWIDPQKLTAELRWEVSDGDIFPHVYGPLNLNAVVSTVDFLPDAEGNFLTLPKPE